MRCAGLGIGLRGLDDLVVLVDRDVLGRVHGLDHLLAGLLLKPLLVFRLRRLDLRLVDLVDPGDLEKGDGERLQLLLVDIGRLGRGGLHLRRRGGILGGGADGPERQPDRGQPRRCKQFDSHVLVLFQFRCEPDTGRRHPRPAPSGRKRTKRHNARTPCRGSGHDAAGGQV